MELIEFPLEIKLINGFLEPERCAEIIAHADALGYDEAPINTLQGAEIFKEVRNNNRVMYDDFELADELLLKVLPYLSREYGYWKLHSLNERFRIYRYQREQCFRWHRDGSFMRTPGEESKITFMIYLNEGFAGGETEFQHCRITPREGAALLFPHPLTHQGAPVEDGVKYVLRTDVMYKMAV